MESAGIGAGAARSRQRRIASEVRPMRVVVKDSQSFEKALKRFKRECIREGLIADMRRSEFYEKPSVKKRRKANRARRRRLRLQVAA